MVAYIVPVHAQLPNVSELRNFVKANLPEYMVPFDFVPLDALPLTSSGKVDRRSLPEPKVPRPDLGTSYAPPRTPLEKSIADIWANALGRERIGIEDNFFELGGHSLLVTQVMSRIGRALNMNLPLRVLFEQPTVAGLASVLTKQTEVASWSSLVAIQGMGSKRPLFCIHPIGGNVFCYTDLAHQLGPDQPLYGLQAPGLSGEQPPFTQIETMAAHYLKVIRTRQPDGPYFLCGWSMGGVVAFEIAQQLKSHRQKVALLAILDTVTPATSMRLTPVERSAADDVTLVAYFAENLGLISSRDSLPHSQFAQLTLDEQLTYILEQTKMANVSPGLDLQQIQNYYSVFKANVLAVECYIAHPYPGRIALFKASEELTPRRSDLTAGWANLATGGIDTYLVPGNHYTMVKFPQVRTLAEQLTTYLQLVGRDGTQGSVVGVQSGDV